MRPSVGSIRRCVADFARSNIDVRFSAGSRCLCHPRCKVQNVDNESNFECVLALV
jgi:hypothetical protein